MGTAVASLLSTRLPTLLALSFATKDSKLMVRLAEHVKLIINGMALPINVKVSSQKFAYFLNV